MSIIQQKACRLTYVLILYSTQHHAVANVFISQKKKTPNFQQVQYYLFFPSLVPTARGRRRSAEKLEEKSDIKCIAIRNQRNRTLPVLFAAPSI